tara:strand:+ start:9168 stop:9317 length:150 start_codon:yes stop_codon:yes gene_type:complete
MFYPVSSTEELLLTLQKTRNKIALLKIKENKLIDELIKTKQGENDAENN